MTNFHDVYLLMMCVYHCLGLQSVAQYYMTKESHNIPENEKLLTVRIKTRIMFLVHTIKSLRYFINRQTRFLYKNTQNVALHTVMQCASPLFIYEYKVSAEKTA